MLPDAITRSYDHDSRLRTSLREPLEDSIGDAVRRDPRKFADALFPVIGPAIRKAISEALKSLVQSLNRAAETSLSPTARLKAWRAGVPLGEWVLKNSLVYRVDEVYLINPDSGLLIAHVSHDQAADKDEDAISAMLTAIQDFVRDSFSAGQSALDSAAIGEFTMWISHGPRAMLAALVRGTPPAQLRPLLDSTVERIHMNYSRALRDFSGVPIRGVDAELEECLLFRLREEASRAARMSWPLRIVLLGLAALVVWWLVNGFLLDRKLQQWGDALRAEPGIIVTQLERDGREFVAAGLRDPLAVEPTDLARAAQIPAQATKVDFRPFQSLDEQILVARARQVLVPPATVNIQIADGRLVATGVAPQSWRQRVQSLAPAIAGVSEVDMSGVLPDDSDLLSAVVTATNPPSGVNVKVVGGVAQFSGFASAEWIGGLDVALAGVAELKGIDRDALERSELLVLRRLAAEVHGQEVFFAEDARLSSGQRARVAQLAAQILLFARNAESLGLEPQLLLEGFTDDSGLLDSNRDLQIDRAETARRLLISDGVDARWLRVRRAATVGEGSLTIDPSRRKVLIEVLTSGPDGRSLLSP